MTIISLLQTWSTFGPIVFIRDSKYGMPAVQSFHLMGLTILLATVLVLSLGLAGVGLREVSPSALAWQLKPWMIGGMTLVIASGIFIFLATPQKYLSSNPFRIKMALLCLAILFQFTVVRRIVALEPVPRPRPLNVIVACVSLTLWFGVGWAGRAIAFVP